MSSAHVQLRLTLISATAPSSHKSLHISSLFRSRSHLSSKQRSYVAGATAEFGTVVEDEFFEDESPCVARVALHSPAGPLAEFEVPILPSTGKPVTYHAAGHSVTVAVSCRTVPSAAAPSLDLTLRSPLLPLCYLLAFALWLLPQHLPVPYVANIMLTVFSLVVLGSLRSLQQRDPVVVLDADGNAAPLEAEPAMTASDAMQFPLFGSASLFSLYCAFKYLDKDWVNFFIGFYFTAVGALAVAATLAPVLDFLPLPALGVKRKWLLPHPLPAGVLGPSPLDLSFDLRTADLLAIAAAVGVGGAYFQTK
ncbi:hypothetical protein TeGR_g8356, partial [Tetraparma gracilis]